MEGESCDEYDSYYNTPSVESTDWTEIKGRPWVPPPWADSTQARPGSLPSLPDDRPVIGADMQTGAV